LNQLHAQESPDRGPQGPGGGTLQARSYGIAFGERTNKLKKEKFGAHPRSGKEGKKTNNEEKGIPSSLDEKEEVYWGGGPTKRKKGSDY